MFIKSSKYLNEMIFKALQQKTKAVRWIFENKVKKFLKNWGNTFSYQNAYRTYDPVYGKPIDHPTLP